MKHYFFALFLLFSAFYGYSQQFAGRVYGQDAPIEGALVSNKTQKITVNTDVYGDFSIAANRGDSIVFSAPFYEKQILKIEQEQLANPWVVELKSDLNQLDEVTVTKKAEEKKFDIKEYNAKLNAGIKEDMKNNPGNYGLAPSGSMDFVKIAGLLVNLFKKEKNSHKKEMVTKVTLEKLTELLKTDDLINDELLTERLHIPEKYHGLFLDYCLGKGINPELLAEDYRFQLLDVLVKYNSGFQKILADYKTSNG